MDISNANEIQHNNNAQTRLKIVEILSGTANGCLAELGYHPNMPQKFKELQQQNENWRLENMKLYQDNASLLGLIRQQNERIKLIRAPEQEKTIRIMELDTELQKVKTQRDELARLQAAKDSVPSQLQQNFVQLQGDYVRVINGFRAKCAEIDRLRQAYASMFHPHPQHQLQKQSQQQSRPLPQQNRHHQPLHQPQSTHFRVQHPQLNRPAQRQSAPTLLQPHAQIYIQQQHQPLHAISRVQPGQEINALSPPVLGQGQKENTQSPGQGQKYPVFEQMYMQEPRPRQSSGSIPAPFVDMDSLFSGAQSFSSHPNLKLPYSNGFRAATSQPTSPALARTTPESQSRGSYSHNSNPPTPVVPSPLSQHFFAPPSSNFINTDTASAGTSISPVTAVPHPEDIALGLPAFMSPDQSLKRESPSQSEGDHGLIMMEPLQKKLRLEGPRIGLTPTASVMNGTEDEDEDIVEVGPDGLRLVKDCISDLFGEEGEGEERYCKLCIARRSMGYSIDPLKSFVNATNDELEKHCMTEHAEAWEALRHSV